MRVVSRARRDEVLVEVILSQSPARPYSYRSASTGSNRDARYAGSSPNTIPVSALVTSAATIASGGIVASIGVDFAR